MALTFFYPEYEGKRTLPQAYVKDAIRRQQELNELCGRNTAQAQMRQRKKYDEKILQAKPYDEVGQYVWVFQNVRPEKIEADSEAESFVEEDWNDPEQGEVPNWTEPDLPIPAGTRSGNRKRTGMRYNRYGDDFLIDKIQPDELSEELISVGELAADDEWQIINDSEQFPQEDYSRPEQETDLEQSEIERRENTNLRILEWMRDVKNGNGEGKSIQQVDVSAGKHMKTEDPLFGWTATDRPLENPPDNLDPAPSTGTSIKIFVRGVGVGLTHTESLMIKKLREVRETSELELDGEEAEPTIGRNFKTEIPNKYSENILITDSDFILSDRTSAICITADMSFKSRLEADFKREYQNVEFLFRQRPGLGGMAALRPSVAQVSGKYLCFLVTRVKERNTIDPERVMLALTRLREFMIERGIMEVSMPVYDQQGQVEPKGVICHPTRSLCRNGYNGTSAQEIILDYRLSRVYGGSHVGYKGISS